MTIARDLTVPEISAMLAARIGQLAPELLSGGCRVGSEWACADITGRKARTGGSLRVHLTGQHKGHWRDHAIDEGGDPIDLIQGALGLDKGGAVRWGLHWLGLGDNAPVTKRRPKSKPVEPTADERRRAAKGAAIWQESGSITGTLAELYLREHRGITVELPQSLRFHPGLDYWDTESDKPVLLGQFPALIAGITVCPSRSVVAAHAVYLDAVTGGKANLDPVKKTFGPAAGGAVRLAAHGPRLMLCEGVETGLSVWQACPGLLVWATVGTAGYCSLILPPGVQDITIAADADEAGEAAAQKAAQRFMAEGCRVKIARPPNGYGDFNDALMAQQSANARKAVNYD